MILLHRTSHQIKASVVKRRQNQEVAGENMFLFNLLWFYYAPSAKNCPQVPPVVAALGWNWVYYFLSIIYAHQLWRAFPFLSPTTLLLAQTKHEALHFTSRKKPLSVILYVFSVLFITTLTAGVKWETSRKNLPRLPSDKVELKLKRGITWTKAPQGRE